MFGLSRRKDRRKQHQLRALAVMRTAFSDAQRNAIELWCHQNKAHIIAWVEDDFPFGAPWHHSSLEQWLAARPPAEWDVLVAHGMERMMAAYLVDWCDDHGKQLVLPSERVDSGTWVRSLTLPQ